MWRQQLAAQVLIIELDRQLVFWDDYVRVRAASDPVAEAWLRARRYGPGARGLYAGPRRTVIARLLLAPAAVTPDRARLALYGMAVAATWQSHEKPAARRSKYLVGEPFLEPLQRGARAITRAANSLSRDPSCTASDVRRLFEAAAPVILAAPGLPAEWDDALDARG